MSRSKSEYQVWLFASVWRLGLQSSSMGVWWPAERFLLSWQAFVIIHKQVGVRYLFTPENISSMSSCRFRQWNTPSHGILITLVHQFFRWAFAYDMIWWSFSYICCADLMKNNPEIKKIQVLRVLFWCGDKYDTLGHIRAGRVYGKETLLIIWCAP